MIKLRIPEQTIKRLPIYLRLLEQVKQKVISSAELEKISQINSANIRKDLSYFGEFGHRGRGYDVDLIKNKIKEIIGIARESCNVVIVGAGNIAKAILGYRGFGEYRINVVGIFDNSKKKIGKSINGICVQAVDNLEKFIKKRNIRLAILSVSENAADQVAKRLDKCGVKGILNFTPVYLNVSDEVKVLNVDITRRILGLFCHINLVNFR